MPEVMWPRLVANKLLGKPLGNYCFVTDLPRFEFDNSGERQLDTLKYKLFATTWNVGGEPPTGDLDLDNWLDIDNGPYDIYVIGLQEVVPLNAKNVLGSEKRKITTKWNSLIRETLNKEEEKEKVLKPVRREFRCLISKQMVGIFISVWVRGDLEPYIRHENVSCIGCGLLSCLGNKGSVSVRFFLHDTSFCFVCCHLASGGKEGDVIHRNSDAMEILSRTIFPRDPSLHLPQKILDHDRVILLGDLNYRISLPEEKTRALLKQKLCTILLQNDQLMTELSRGRAFDGWQEGAITFLPTYKYYRNSDLYYGRCQGTKGEKRRAPAWCDRILWHGEGMKQHVYDRSEARLSDHRPVKAVFTVDTIVPHHLKTLGSFRTYDRFKVTKQLCMLEDLELAH